MHHTPAQKQRVKGQLCRVEDTPAWDDFRDFLSKSSKALKLHKPKVLELVVSAASADWEVQTLQLQWQLQKCETHAPIEASKLSLAFFLSLSLSLSLRAMGSRVCPTPSPARERAAAVLGGNEFPGGGFAPPQARFYTAKKKSPPTDGHTKQMQTVQCSN